MKMFMHKGLAMFKALLSGAVSVRYNDSAERVKRDRLSSAGHN
jgi:hypothetical protein